MNALRVCIYEADRDDSPAIPSVCPGLLEAVNTALAAKDGAINRCRIAFSALRGLPQHSPVGLLPNQATSRPGRMQESYDQILSGLPYLRPDQI